MSKELSMEEAYAQDLGLEEKEGGDNDIEVVSARSNVDLVKGVVRERVDEKKEQLVDWARKQEAGGIKGEQVEDVMKKYGSKVGDVAKKTFNTIDGIKTAQEKGKLELAAHAAVLGFKGAKGLFGFGKKVYGEAQRISQEAQAIQDNTPRVIKPHLEATVAARQEARELNNQNIKDRERVQNQQAASKAAGFWGGRA